MSRWFDAWEYEYDTRGPYDDEDCDCHAGPEDGCSCPKCMRDDRDVDVED